MEHLTLWHLLSALIAGGCATPLVQWLIDKFLKGKKSFKAILFEKLEEHEKKDDVRFTKLDDMHDNFIVPMKTDLAYIRGKLDGQDMEKKTI